jgi:hypothetical protein
LTSSFSTSSMENLRISHVVSLSPKPK